MCDQQLFLSATKVTQVKRVFPSCSISTPEHDFTVIGRQTKCTFYILKQLCRGHGQRGYSVKISWFILRMTGEIDIVSVMGITDFVIDRISWWNKLHVNVRAEADQPKALASGVLPHVRDLFRVR